MGKDDITIVSSTDSDADVALALAGPPAADAPKVETKPPDPVPDPAATPAAEPVAGAEPEPEPEPEVKAETPSERRIRKIQQSIDDATRRKHDAQREADAEEKRYNEAKAKREALEAAPPATEKPDGSDRPKLNDLKPDGTPKYANYEEFLEAGQDWTNARADKAIAAARAELEEKLEKKQTAAQRASLAHETAARAEQTALAGYETQLTAFKADHADFDAVLTAATETVQELVEDFGPDVLNVIDRYAIYDADHGPAINHYLASHPDDLRRIAALPIPQQLAALGKLDERLAPAKTSPTARPAKPATSSAPAPMKPVGGSPTSSTVPLEDEPYPVYKARRAREERAAAGLPPL